MKQAIFPDGSLIEGETWFAVELVLRRDPWNPKRKKKFRRALSARAWNWSRTDVDDTTEQSALRFLRGLERAGIVRLEDTSAA